MKLKIPLQKYTNHYRILLSVIVTTCIFYFYSCNRPAQNGAGHPFDSETSFNDYLNKQDSVLSRLPKDSARSYLKEKLYQVRLAGDDHKELLALSGLGDYFSQNGHFDSANVYFKKALKIALEINGSYSAAYQLVQIAEGQNSMAHNDSSIYYLKMVEQYIDTLTSTKLQASYYNVLGVVNTSIGLYNEALKAYFKAEAILKKINNSSNLNVLYNNIANVFKNLDDEQKRLEYLNMALGHTSPKDEYQLSMIYSNLGVFYKENDSLLRAMEYYQKGLILAKKANNVMAMAQNYLNISNVNKGLGRYSLAASYYDSTNLLCAKYDIGYGLLLVKINSGDLNIQEGNYSIAEKLLQEALIDAKNSDLIQEEVSIYQFLCELYKKNGNFEKALTYNELYVEMNDSLIHERNSEIIRNLLNEQERLENQREKAALNNKILSARLSRNIIIFILLIVILAFGFLVYFIITAKRKVHLKKELAEKENENLILTNKAIKLDLKNVKTENILIAERDNKKQLLIQIKEQELLYHTLKQADLMQFVKSVVDNLTPFIYKITRKKDRDDFEKAINRVAQNCSNNPLTDFENMFIQMHGDFYEKLLAISPDFSRSELQMCALLRMNLPSKEIARLLNITNSTVDVTRHRIRQKLGLDSSDHLISKLIMI